jgi:Tfp pilus assembly protein PilO
MKVEERQKFLLIVTIAVVGLWLGNMILFQPLGKWWSARSHEIKLLRHNVIDGKTNYLANADGITGSWNEMVTNTLPSNSSLAEQQLLRAFNSWASESGATVTGITPQWKEDSTNYMTLNCRVEASGDVGTLSRFVYDIEKGPLGLKLDSVEFSTHDNLGQQLTLGLEISGLVLTTLK